MSLSNYLVTLGSFIKQPHKRSLIRQAFALRGKKGLEIGGPSTIFGLKSLCPVYVFAKNIDGVNFSTSTIWEGAIQEGRTYHYFDGKKGYQFIAEATGLSMISDKEYDFLLSSHSLEHVANPIRALKEWNRVLKTNGVLLLILPDKRNSFDINRPYTDFEHLLQDYVNHTDEHDTTHFEEIISCHDFSKDAVIQNRQAIEETLRNNYSNRMAHHHVFSQELVRQMLEYCGFALQLQTEAMPFHLVTIARKK